MSADNDIQALRAAGHDDAADLLTRVRHQAMQTEAVKTPPGTTDPATVPLMATDPHEENRRAQGQAILDSLRAAGMLDRGISAGSLLGGTGR